MLINTRIGMTPDEVKQKVESWNWNASIFEMYDEVKEMPSWDRQEVVSYAYEFFNADPMVQELAHFFHVDLTA